MKKYFLVYAFLCLFISCKGQKKENIALPTTTKNSSVESFKKQKHRIEIKGHKIYYNEKLLKLDTLVNTIKILERPTFQNPSEFLYNNKPIRAQISATPERDKNGRWLFKYKDIKYSLPPGNYDQNKENEKMWDLWSKAGGYNSYLYLKDKDGNYMGRATSYFIYLRPFEEGRKYPLKDSDPFEKAMKSTPVVDGYVLIDGVPVDKNTTIPDIIKTLKPVVGNNLGKIMGEPVIVYELSEKEMKEINPIWGSDRAYDRIFIGFEMIYDPVTKKSTGLKSIHYYCFM